MTATRVVPEWVVPMGVRCMLMRGGTSKGAYFLPGDLPDDREARDDLLLRLLGSPDPRQVDGIGGGHPLTSKVALVSTSNAPDADLEYLFLQVVVDQPVVTAGQPCGNILAGVGPFALERGLLAAPADGPLTFADTGGAVCGSLLPTGHVRDVLEGIPVTCIDNGMPVVAVAAGDLGASGWESCRELESNEPLRQRVEAIRLAAGHAMGLGDVTDRTVPKMTLLAPPRHGGAVTTRTFIPHQCHTSIGVLGAVSVATAVCLAGSVAAEVAGETGTGETLRGGTSPGGRRRVRLEHPTGFFDTDVERDSVGRVTRAAVLSTARKLFDGVAWPRETA